MKLRSHLPTLILFRVVFIGLVVATGVSARAANSKAVVAPSNPLSKPAFIERVPPGEFLAIEGLGPKPFSVGADLVILKTEGNKVTYALTLRSDAAAGFVWDAYFLMPNEPVTPTVSIEFENKTARQYLGALNLRMSRWVTVVEKSHKPDHYDAAWWFYYRVQNGAIAGLIDNADFQSNSEAAKFAETFIKAPQRLLNSTSAEREAIVAEIDQTCTDILRAPSVQ